MEKKGCRYQGSTASRSMIMIGLAAKRRRARQRGMRLNIGISTALQRRSTYSMLNTITEKTLNASKKAP